MKLEADRPFGFVDSPPTTRSAACTGMDLHPTEKHLRESNNRITSNTVSLHITHHKEGSRHLSTITDK